MFDMEFHRGGRDARSENTLYSYLYSLEYGATTIECDIQLTKDNVIVMSHNPSLNPDITVDKYGIRIKDNTYFIHDMTLNEIKEFNVGCMDKLSEYYKIHGITQIESKAFIPTLEELFILIKESNNKDIKVSIEAKYYADKNSYLYNKNPNKDILLNEFVRLVKKYDMEKRVILQSFDWSILVKLKEINKNIETIALYVEENSWNDINSKTLWLDKKEKSPWLAGINIHDFNNVIDAINYLKIDNVSPYYKYVKKEDVLLAHKYNMKIIPWTVNNIKDMKYLYDLGVDGIITDKPWVLREFLISMGEYVKDIIKIDSIYHIDKCHNDIKGIIINDGIDAKK